jgi:hypothetical protein
MIDLSSKTAQLNWLKDEDLDTEYVEECLAWVRSFCDKDKEVVCLEKPPSDAVEWWSPDTKSWMSLQRWSGPCQQDPPAATSKGPPAAKSQDVPAATSQDPRAPAQVATTPAATSKVPLQNEYKHADRHQKQTTYTYIHTHYTF